MTVKGVVLDEFGEPLDGANVYYVNPFTNEYEADNPGAVSGSGMIPGYYELPYIPSGRIAASYLGYETKFRDVYPPIIGDDSIYMAFEMERGAYDLPPVIITPDKNDNANIIFLAAIVAVLLFSDE